VSVDKPAGASVQLNRRQLAVGLAFLSAAGLAAIRTPRIHQDFSAGADLKEVIPAKIGDWSFETASGLVVPPEDQLSRALYSQLLTRVYTDGRNSPVMLLVAQSARQTGVLQIHRPEACYPAGGYTLSPVRQYEFSTDNGGLRANFLSATNELGSEHIIYWTRVGRHMPLSWAEQRWSIAKDNFEGIIPDAVLARISVVHEDPGLALGIMVAFVRSLLGSLPEKSRQLLVARSST